MPMPFPSFRIAFSKFCMLFLASALLCGYVGRTARADDSKKGEDMPMMAVVPPATKALQGAPREDAQVNPSQIMTQVIPRVVKEVNGKKWPFRMLPQETVTGVYDVVAGGPRDSANQPRFATLKPLAEKIGCRYLLLVAVNELVSTRKQELFSDRLRARADLTMIVYDHDANDYVYSVTQIGMTNHPNAVVGRVGMQREQDGALHAAMIKGLEPFVKGKRMQVERPALSILATVQKVLADGKKVVLDAGRPQGVGVGDVFQSVESDCQVKIIEILDNGSIAEVVSGTPHEKEVMKPKP